MYRLDLSEKIDPSVALPREGPPFEHFRTRAGSCSILRNLPHFLGISKPPTEPREVPF